MAKAQEPRPSPASPSYRSVRIAAAIALGVVAYVVASLGILNFAAEGDELSGTVFVFAALAFLFFVFAYQLGRFAIRNSWAGLLVATAAMVGAVALFGASTPSDDSKRGDGSGILDRGTGAGSRGGGGYTDSPAFRARQLCDERYPGFSQMDQAEACVQSILAP